MAQLSGTATYLPLVVILVSGKRKCGKDFVSETLCANLGKTCAIFRLSAPLKKSYATIHTLDLDQLMSATEYKEIHRKNMIEWGEEVRNKDPGYFCRLATEEGHLYTIWIISDVRRHSDVSYFRQKYNCVTVKVAATQSVREERGFKFVDGVDNAQSECGLDNLECDITIQNDGTVPLPEVSGYKELVALVLPHIQS
ncbi:Phosphomevalonate kinase-like [Oopsacas minuta]|uniref:Phosphomevalonate kinase n=1 Tax=Oopsacas minuta TaxID=111878 RepID=A0AAV7KGD4_9METZ|nr:Phosphomevalonate kinase-like [Oopsacas minuta]